MFRNNNNKKMWCYYPKSSKGHDTEVLNKYSIMRIMLNLTFLSSHAKCGMLMSQLCDAITFMFIRNNIKEPDLPAVSCFCHINIRNLQKCNMMYIYCAFTNVVHCMPPVTANGRQIIDSINSLLPAVVGSWQTVFLHCHVALAWIKNSGDWSRHCWVKYGCYVICFWIYCCAFSVA